MRALLMLTALLYIFDGASAQTTRAGSLNAGLDRYSYAYITIQGKGLGKKLNVEVDLGESSEQRKQGKEYSDTLTNKKSYAAILNYMSDNKYELVESRDLSLSYQGTGGTYGIIFIMRKRKEVD